MGGKQHTALEVEVGSSDAIMKVPFQFKINEEYKRAVFPLAEEEIETLRNSIIVHGMLMPIITNSDGVILDGHHRYGICEELKLDPDKPQHIEKKFIDPLEEKLFVLTCNLERRNLTPLQRAIIGKTIFKIEQLKARQRQQMTQFGRGDGGGKFATTEEEGKARDFTAKRVGLKPRTFQYALYILDRAPQEEIDRVLTGERTISNLYKEVRRWESIEEKRRRIKNLQIPDGQFNVIVIDPPWPYGTPYDPDGRRVASPYPEMSVEDIEKEFENIKLHVYKDCALWFWTTNAFMHDALHIVEKWGFEQKTILTWGKVSNSSGELKPQIGLGDWLRGQTEHCILAVKGNPTIKLTNQSTLLLAKNNGHSKKPDEFYALVDSLCYGRKLDYFAGKNREGWHSYGTLE